MDERSIHTFLMQTMTTIAEAMDEGDTSLSEVERRFTDADGTECGIWNQDVTLFTILTSVIPDPAYLDVAINN